MMKMHDRTNVGKILIKPEQQPKPKVSSEGPNLSFNTTVNVMKYLGVFSNSNQNAANGAGTDPAAEANNEPKDVNDINDE